ncbi:MAG: leucine-rich repeat protein, partial [Muribaculaceae bacterium]|nr:leucine-rich repeat protein [Muribaculaceae bacterium]
TSLIQYPIGRKNETSTIPNTVTSIGEYAFKFCKNLISVVIPNSVTSLGHSAFNTCTSLQSIALPNSIILIDTYAFYNCTSLESISVDENNPNYASVEGVLFDKAITSLIQYPIGRKNDTYTIPNTVTSIGELAFKFCKNLTSVSIPNSVTTIGSKAFDTCSSLLSVTIPNSVISLGERAFAECTSLKSISLSNSVKAIGNHAFAYCKSLNSIIIPSSVTSIEESTFYDCEALASISIPNSVTSIGFRAFWYCFSLKSLFIPSSVTSIGEQAFNVCSSLESITVDDRNTNYSSLDGALFDKDKKILIQYPIGKKDTKYVIPSSVISVGKRAFYRGESLNTIIISNSVLSIDEWAFSYCTSLSSLTIPNSVTSINNSFLHGKNNLKLLKVKSNQVFIGNLNVSNTVLAENVVLAVPKNKFNEYREAYPNNKVISVDEVGFEPESYELAVKPSVLNTLSLFIDAFENVNGFQMDVTLPEGLAIAEVDGKLDVSFGEGAAAASHTLTASKVTGSNKYRIVAYSSKNEPFLAGEDLLNIAVEADENFKGGEINVSDVFISTTDGEGYQGIDFSINANVDYALSIGDDISLEEGETWQLAPAVNPSIEDLTLEWASTNPDVAYVDADGMLHAVTPGEAVITASNSEYGISASINVTVTPILYGDANDNGIVTIDDVVTDVQYILEKDPQPFSFRKADVNKDTRINILDVSKTVAIVLANEEQPQALRAHLCGVVGPSASLSAENIRLDADGRAVMTLRLNGDADITALQGDICLPEGVRVSNISMAGEQKGDHIISFAELKSGATRFAVYSMSLASVTANSALIEVELESENLFVEGEASVDDIYVSDTDCNLLRMESVSVDVSGASAVNEISSDPNAPADVYNMQGVLILRNATQSELNALTPGLYIVNGKKIQIR